MLTLIGSVVGLVLGILAGLWLGLREVHSCRTCRVRLLRFCTPGTGCKRPDDPYANAAGNANALALASAQIRDGRTAP